MATTFKPPVAASLPKHTVIEAAKLVTKTYVSSIPNMHMALSDGQVIEFNEEGTYSTDDVAIKLMLDKLTIVSPEFIAVNE